jgi:type IV secretion system protein VirB9
LIFVVVSSVASALQYPRATSGDSRIKLINYNSNAVHVYTGYYGYQSSIVFSPEEEIGTISMGDSTAWQLIPQNNRLFLKPMENNATTNVTIITNMRIYHFEFHAEEAKGINDPSISYEVHFVYPELASGITSGFGSGSAGYAPDLASPEGLNFEYLVAGSDQIKPIRVFDDGQFTYMEFDGVNANLPAAFLVDSEGYESMINFRIAGNYMVIERVDARFTLRHGKEVACVINKTIPYEHKRTKKQKTGILKNL